MPLIIRVVVGQQSPEEFGSSFDVESVIGYILLRYILSSGFATGPVAWIGRCQENGWEAE